MITNAEIKEIALSSLVEKRDRLNAQIASLMDEPNTTASRTRSQPVSNGAAPVKRKKKRHLSAKGRAAISAASKKRWAEIKKQKR